MSNCYFNRKFVFTTYRVDDIEDNSKLRRGIPVAHAVFGIPWTINAANFAYFIGLQKVIELGNEKATKVYTGLYFKLTLILQDN